MPTSDDPHATSPGSPSRGTPDPAPTTRHAPTLGSDLSTASGSPLDGLATRPTDAWPETQFGDFRVLDRLGQGGMGVVYRALDPRRGIVVALKTLGVDARLSLTRFKREFRSLADAVHPNLVKLYELAADGPRWYFTMELVEGEDFSHHVRPARSGSPDYSRLRSALRQLAEGVSALHERRILHRDLKPSNVKVAYDGRVVLLDFGLAAEMGPDDAHLSSTPHFCGTMAYMAPEQAACLALTPASDWYAVGVMLYEALTGKLPYSGSLMTLMRLKQEEDPPAPSAIASDVPADLEKLCLDLMRRDPSERPSGREVLERLGSHAPAAPRSTAKEAPFVGREATLAILRQAYRDVRGGRTTAVLVHGASGMGKSSLVAKFLEEIAADPRAAVLAGRCYESESVPFKAVDGLVDALAAFLRHLPRDEADRYLPRDTAAMARVFPVFHEVDVVANASLRSTDSLTPQELRLRAFDALRELLGRIGDRRPLVIALDDLQWGDVDGAALLLELLRPADRPIGLLVLAYRRDDAERSECLKTLRADWPDDVRRVEAPIDALSRDEVAALAKSALTQSDVLSDDRLQSLLDQIASESAGSPFFIQELVARAKSRRVDEPGASLDDVLRGRIDALSATARTLLDVIAVAGTPIRRSDAYAAAGVAPEDPAAERLRNERLLRGAPSPDGEARLETYHDRVRETTVARLDADALRACHRRLAETLSREGRGDAQTLARHFDGAGDADRAAHYFVLAAADASQKLAFDHAAGLYQRAMELQPANAKSLRAPLAEALADAGRGREAAEEFVRAAEQASPREALQWQQKAAAQYLGAGRLDDGLELLTRMLTALGVRFPKTHAEALLTIVGVRLWLSLRGLGLAKPKTKFDEHTREDLEALFQIIGALTVADPLRGQALQSQVLLTSLQRGDPVGAARAIAYQTVQFALSTRQVGWTERAYMARAKELAAELRHPEVDATVMICEGVTSYLHGGWSKAVECCARAATMFEKCSTGFRWDREVARIWEFNALYFMGELKRLSERLKPCLASAAARNDLHALVNHGTFTQTMLMIADDRPDDAIRSIDLLLERWAQSGFHVPHYNGMLTQAHAALYAGDLAEARRRVDRCLAGARQAGMTWLQIVRATLEGFEGHVRLAEVEAGADKRLLKAVDATAARLAREGVRWARAVSGGLRAGAAHLRGERDSAITFLEQAEKDYRAAEMGLWADACRRHWARLVGGDAGAKALAEVDRAMTEQLVKRPERMAAMMIAGFQRV